MPKRFRFILSGMIGVIFLAVSLFPNLVSGANTVYFQETADTLWVGSDTVNLHMMFDNDDTLAGMVHPFTWAESSFGINLVSKTCDNSGWFAGSAAEIFDNKICSLYTEKRQLVSGMRLQNPEAVILPGTDRLFGVWTFTVLDSLPTLCMDSTYLPVSNRLKWVNNRGIVKYPNYAKKCWVIVKKPFVSNVTPNRALALNDRDITINGENFENGVTVKLLRSGNPAYSIGASLVTFYSGKKIIARFNLEGEEVFSHWDIMVTNSHGFSDTLNNCLEIVPPLTVDFTATPTRGRKPLNVSFQAIYNVMPDKVTWYFGDGQTSQQLNPFHKYNNLGNYDVKLVGELFEDKDSLTKEAYIKVSDIKAGFGASKKCGSIPLTVEFTDSSTSTYPITNWHWDFGDGNESFEQNPTHQFTSKGVFDVKLIVNDSIGADTLTQNEYITTQDSVSADFIGVPNSGKSPLTVMFEPILVGLANEYFWEFGDGETSSLKNPIHIYTTQGKYDVKLKVKLELDDCSQVDSIIKDDYVIVNNLQAQFEANPTAGIKPLQVQFTDLSSGAPDSWFWNFGDGYTSTEQNPLHQYYNSGTYDVFLRVSNTIGVDSLLKLKYIQIADSLNPDLFAEVLGPGGARPGFDIWFYSIWTNIGSAPALNCTLKILLPHQMTFYYVYPIYTKTGTYSGYSFSGDTIIIPLATIGPSNRYGGYIRLYGNLPPTVPIGDTLICQMWLTSSTPEQNYINNHVLFRQVVTGSIDPNDKLASPEGEGSIHKIGPDQRLGYTIRFENKPEATAEAIYIRVVDTLDQNLDWGTLALGASSHPAKCNSEFDPYTGVITWFCDSIMLPPNVNPPEGEGYFTYSISPKKDLPNGTSISNSAWIRFDYNAWLQAPEKGPLVRTIDWPCMCGDANKDWIVDIGDIVYLINYVFYTGPIPVCEGDVNIDEIVDIADIVYLINYVFYQGSAPACQ